jgi:hypothetical protein
MPLMHQVRRHYAWKCYRNARSVSAHTPRISFSITVYRLCYTFSSLLLPDPQRATVEVKRALLILHFPSD